MDARIDPILHDPAEAMLRERLMKGMIPEVDTAQAVDKVLAKIDHLRGENAALRYENDRLNHRADQKQKAKARRREREKRNMAISLAILIVGALLISIIGNLFGCLIFTAFGIF